MKTRAGRLPAAALAVGVAFLCVATAVAAWQVHAARQEQGDAFAALAKEVTPVYRHCLLTFSGGAVLRDIPLAETKVQQDKGLSGRNDVEPEMLFTFPKPDRLMFWMRDTQVPLSVGFFDPVGRLFKIEDMQANTDDFHFSMSDATDALELPQGRFQVVGLSVGSRLISRDCH